MTDFLRLQLDREERFVPRPAPDPLVERPRQEVDLPDPVLDRMRRRMASDEIDRALRMEEFFIEPRDPEERAILDRFRRERAEAAWEAGMVGTIVPDGPEPAAFGMFPRFEPREPSIVDRVLDPVGAGVGAFFDFGVAAGYGLFSLFEDPVELNRVLGLEGVLGSEKPDADVLVDALSRVVGSGLPAGAAYREAADLQGRVRENATVVEDVARFGAETVGFVGGLVGSAVGKAIQAPGKLLGHSVGKTAPGWMKAAAEIGGTAVGWGAFQGLAQYYDPATGELNGAGKRLAAGAEAAVLWPVYDIIGRGAVYALKTLKDHRVLEAFREHARGIAATTPGAPADFSKQAFRSWWYSGMPGYRPARMAEAGELALVSAFEAAGMSVLDAEMRGDVWDALWNEDQEAADRAVKHFLGTWLGLTAIKAGGVEQIVPWKRRQAGPFQGFQKRSEEPGTRDAEFRAEDGDGTAAGGPRPQPRPGRPGESAPAERPDAGTPARRDARPQPGFHVEPLEHMGWRPSPDGVYRLEGDPQRTFRIGAGGDIEPSPSLLPVVRDRDPSLPAWEALQHATLRNHLEARRIFSGLGREVDTDGSRVVPGKPSQHYVVRFGEVYRRPFFSNEPWRRASLPAPVQKPAPEQGRAVEALGTFLAEVAPGVHPELLRDAIEALKVIRDVPRERDEAVDSAIRMVEDGTLLAVAQAAGPDAAVEALATVTAGHTSPERVVEMVQTGELAPRPAEQVEPAAQPAAGEKELWQRTRQEVGEENRRASLKSAVEELSRIAKTPAAKLREAGEIGKYATYKTKAEAIRKTQELIAKIEGESSRSHAGDDHYRAVRVALESGEAVPPEVVAGYPDLAADEALRRAPSAEQIHEAARSAIPKQLGGRDDWLARGDKAFVHRVWEELGQPGTLDEFKRVLLARAQRGEIELVRADLVEAMDPQDVAQSNIHDLHATFNFVRVPKAGELAPRQVEQSAAEEGQPARIPPAKTAREAIDRALAAIEKGSPGEPGSPAEARWLQKRHRSTERALKLAAKELGQDAPAWVRSSPSRSGAVLRREAKKLGVTGLERSHDEVLLDMLDRVVPASKSDELGAVTPALAGAVVAGGIGTVAAVSAVGAANLARHVAPIGAHVALYPHWARSLIDRLRVTGPVGAAIADQYVRQADRAREIHGRLSEPLAELAWRTTGLAWDPRLMGSRAALAAAGAATVAGVATLGPLGAFAGVAGATAATRLLAGSKQARALRAATRELETVVWEPHTLTVGGKQVRIGATLAHRILDDWGGRRRTDDAARIQAAMQDPAIAEVVQSMEAFDRAVIEQAERSGVHTLSGGQRVPFLAAKAGKRMQRHPTASLVKEFLRAPDSPEFEALAEAVRYLTGLQPEKVRESLRDEMERDIVRRDPTETRRTLRYFPDTLEIDGKVYRLLETRPNPWAQKVASKSSKRFAYIEVFGQQGTPGHDAYLRAVDALPNTGKGEIQKLQDLEAVAQGISLDLMRGINVDVEGTGFAKGALRAAMSPGRVLKNFALMNAWIVNIPETYGSLGFVAGWKHTLGADWTLLGAIAKGQLGPLVTDLRNRGVITEEIPYSEIANAFDVAGYWRSFKAGRLADELARQSSKVSILTHIANELNDVRAALAAEHKAIELGLSGGTARDEALLRALQYTPQEAARLVQRGAWSRADIDEFQRRVVAQTQGGTETPAERGWLQNIRLWREQVNPMETFSAMSSRQIVRVAKSLDSMVQDGKMSRAKAAAMAGELIGKKAAAGAAGLFFKALVIYGVTTELLDAVVGDYWDVPTLEDAADLFWVIVGGGPGDALRYQMKKSDELSDVLNVAFAFSVANEMGLAISGSGPYHSMAPADRLGEWVKRNVPAWRLTESAAGDVAFKQGRTQVYEWLGERGIDLGSFEGASGPGTKGAEDVEFQRQMREAMDLLEGGDVTGWRTAVLGALRESGNRQKTAASLRSRSLLSRLERHLDKDTMRELRAALPERQWAAIRQQHDALHGLADAIR